MVMHSKEALAHGCMCCAVAAAVAVCCRKQVEEEPDPAQIAKDMERLAMIKKKRCAQHIGEGV